MKDKFDIMEYYRAENENSELYIKLDGNNLFVDGWVNYNDAIAIAKHYGLIGVDEYN